MTAPEAGSPGLRRLPEDLRERITAWYGEPGRRWLDSLPGLAGELAVRWRLELGDLLPATGNAVQLLATRGDDEVLLKLPMRDEENRDEPHALRAYDGDGAVLLYGYDEASGAMLIERADPGTALSAHPDGPVAAAEVLCALLRRLRRPVQPGLDLPSVAGWARRFAAELPGLSARLPATAAPVVDEAATLARRYAARPQGPELMVNRDAHAGAVLAAGREPWLLTHPRPVVGEPAYEAAQPVLWLLDEPAPACRDGGSAPDPAPGPEPGDGRSGRPAGDGGWASEPGDGGSVSVSVSMPGDRGPAPVAVDGAPGAPAGDSSSGVPVIGVGGPPGRPALVGEPGSPERVVALVALLGRGLGVDPQRVRGWALVRAVGNATWAASLGHDPARDLAQAHALLAAA